MQEREKKEWKRFDGKGFTESEALIRVGGSRECL